jgi:hypothetical protein
MMERRSLLPILPIIILLVVGVMFYLAGDGHYRYFCQDPQNFESPSCLPPACLAAEICTNMLIDLGETQ